MRQCPDGSRHRACCTYLGSPHVQAYSSKSGKPHGATGFEILPDAIVVEFKQGVCYKYTTESCGEAHVNEMKCPAVAGVGLSTYIAKNRPKYADKQ